MTPVRWHDILEIVKGEENASDVEYKSTGIRTVSYTHLTLPTSDLV